MALKKVSELLDKASACHNQMVEVYEEIESLVEREDVKVLAKKLKRHQLFFSEQIDAYKKNGSDKILDAWLFYAPNDQRWNCFENLDLKPGMTAEEVMEIAVQLDDGVLALYSDIAKKAKPDDVKDVFLSLYHNGVEERNRMVSGALFLE